MEERQDRHLLRSSPLPRGRPGARCRRSHCPCGCRGRNTPTPGNCIWTTPSWRSEELYRVSCIAVSRRDAVLGGGWGWSGQWLGPISSGGYHLVRRELRPGGANSLSSFYLLFFTQTNRYQGSLLHSWKQIAAFKLDTRYRPSYYSQLDWSI